MPLVVVQFLAQLTNPQIGPAQTVFLPPPMVDAGPPEWIEITGVVASLLNVCFLAWTLWVMKRQFDAMQESLKQGTANLRHAEEASRRGQRAYLGWVAIKIEDGEVRDTHWRFRFCADLFNAGVTPAFDTQSMMEVDLYESVHVRTDPRCAIPTLQASSLKEGLLLPGRPQTGNCARKFEGAQLRGLISGELMIVAGARAEWTDAFGVRHHSICAYEVVPNESGFVAMMLHNDGD